ncbi:MGH1-like glycoside hydrolase domain-containing protein [Salisaeta longa]|uniref:MGH1-like glycoside hydrolase domain-containing protein n=1 Tax=Salisaeta longa TaxID=503170 RepID=UPI0003B2FDC3|nr:glycogen debranching protein [Salisaeta longa]
MPTGFFASGPAARFPLPQGLAGLALLVALCVPARVAAQAVLFQNQAYTVTDTSVTQGPFRAAAPSRTRLVSNYQRERTALNFKFSINGEDNEAPSGDDHRLRLRPVDGRVLTPVYTFGERPDGSFPRPTVAAPRGTGDSVRVTFRLDMRPVLRSFRQHGFYDPPSGARIAAEDFRSVAIVGDVDPLIWDFERAARSPRFRLTDPDGDGVYHVTLTFAARDVRPLNAKGQAVWTLSKDLDRFPTYRSEQRLVDALYNLSLEELLLSVRDDGAFMAGAKWTGVWTRDISYSILLSLAFLHPEAAKKSLMHKVTPDGRIIQDTGTGGSWPISTDRMTWAVAAWEVYLATGDRDWLTTIYPIIKRSAEDDLRTAYDEASGLFYGESSFLDWREQSYPKWLSPTGIYLSQALGTNAVHYRTYDLLATMAQELGAPAKRWRTIAQSVRAAMNDRLWLPDRGYYGQYRYGRNYYTVSPRAEALGASLSILFGIATGERARTLATHQPVTPFGVPTIWPYIPDIPPYHNASMWPFVQAYWTWANAEAGNTPGVTQGLGSLYRAAALFLTNKENMVIQTGHFEGTQINSDRQLWSVAGTLASVYRVLFGFRLRPDGLHLQPFVPRAYSGTRTLTGVRYHDATLNITMRGHGSRIVQTTLDGEALRQPVIPDTLSGTHNITLLLSGGLPEGRVHHVAHRYTPRAPQVTRTAGKLSWDAVADAVRYRIYRNGTLVDSTTALRYGVAPTGTLSEYQVSAVGPDGFSSFLSAPVRVIQNDAVRTLEPPAPLSTETTGYRGDGYLVLTTDRHTTVTFTLNVDAPGLYALDARYANGSGPVNTDNKAAIRTVLVDNRRVGALVMPQRGDDVWSDWGYSNPLRVRLHQGTHSITVRFTESNNNMNGNVNTAYFDHLRLTRLK